MLTTIALLAMVLGGCGTEHGDAATPQPSAVESAPPTAEPEISAPQAGDKIGPAQITGAMSVHLDADRRLINIYATEVGGADYEGSVDDAGRAHGQWIQRRQGAIVERTWWWHGEEVGEIEWHQRYNANH